MTETAHDVLWRRLKYTLTPQWDLYASLPDIVSGKNVLEVGFGTGAGTVMYAPNAFWVDAIEIDPGAVSFARAMFPLTNVQWLLGNVTNMAWVEKYEAVVMIEALEHVADWKDALRRISKALVQDGMLIMSARNANADLRRWKDLHEREWTSEELTDALGEYFEDVRLFDYTLTHEQTKDTSLTPLVAIARKM